MPEPDNQERTVFPGITQYWMDEGRIVVFKVTATTTRDAVDAWCDAVTALLLAWQEDKPYLSLYDFNETDIFMTPYARKRLYQLANTAPAVYGRTAVVMRDSLSGRIIQLFLRGIGLQGYRERRLFFDTDEALHWLREKL